MIDTICHDAEVLRDIAANGEEIYWNDLRKIFYSAAAPLFKLDNSLNQNHTALDLNENFDENTKRIS
jgi:hypothetical protein